MAAMKALDGARPGAVFPWLFWRLFVIRLFCWVDRNSCGSFLNTDLRVSRTLVFIPRYGSPTGLQGYCPSQRVLDARLLVELSYDQYASRDNTNQARQAAFTGRFAPLSMLYRVDHPYLRTAEVVETGAEILKPR
jgi:hypothetical protein